MGCGGLASAAAVVTCVIKWDLFTTTFYIPNSVQREIAMRFCLNLHAKPGLSFTLVWNGSPQRGPLLSLGNSGPVGPWGDTSGQSRCCSFSAFDLSQARSKCEHKLFQGHSDAKAQRCCASRPLYAVSKLNELRTAYLSAEDLHS